MRLLRNLLLSIKLPWLLWMSVWEIHRVRNRILGMFMGGGDCLAVAPHERTFGTRQVKVVGGSNPMFEFIYAPVGFDPRLVRCWLCVTGRWTVPYWIIGIGEAVRSDDGKLLVSYDEGAPKYVFKPVELLRNEDDEPIQYRFNHEYARIPATLVKAYLKHFPFVGTDNYITRNEVAS